MASDAPGLQTGAYNRWLLLGDKRYERLSLQEVLRYGRDEFGDPDFVSIYGLKPADWYARGVRLLGRTVVECTRDRFADLIGRDVAATISAAGSGPSTVVDPFAGSGNTLYWITRHVRPARSVGFESDDVVFELTRQNLSLVSLGIDVIHQTYEAGLESLTIPDEHLVVLFVSPPWGRALDPQAGLDFRRTTPPVAEILDLAAGVLRGHQALFAIQAYESVIPASLAELTARFEWSSFTVYDINAQAKNPGLLLGSVGWTPVGPDPPSGDRPG